MAVQLSRLILYSLSILFAAAMAGRLFSVHSRQALAFGLVMAAWIANSVLLLVLLIYTMATGLAKPDWHESAITVNAFLMAGTMIALNLIFPGKVVASHDR